MTATAGRVLLTGATGYVGGRLLRRLEERGRPLRCLVRNPEYLAPRTGPATEIARGDLLEPETLAAALAGVDVAYYLVHSMGSGDGFEERDRRAAQNFARAARDAGVRRIVYLGGLADEDQQLSPHLRSRIEVGRILRESGVPTVELRASIVIGSGSLSFELVRSLVEALPVMVTPAWVRVPAQPIAVDDLLDYLESCLDLPLGEGESRVYEIGGSDRVSYADLMREYARQRGLRRWMLPVPVLTPFLSSLWLGLVTPLYARVGRKLIESITNPTVVQDARAHRDFDVEPCSVREAIARALRNEDREFVESRWSDALSSSGAQGGWGGVRVRGRLLDVRERTPRASAEATYAAVEDLGGETGYYACHWLWHVRGFLDLLVGGVGMRRGRPASRGLRVGDALDWWRVDALEPGKRLLLRAEMKVPGRAWLQFDVEPGAEPGSSRLRQTAIFDPSGLSGLLYWYAIYPLHAAVFRRMASGVARAAEARAERATA